MNNTHDAESGKTITLDQNILWTRRFGDDFCSGVLTPLFFSILRDRLGDKYARYYKGHLYVPLPFVAEFFQSQNYPKFIRPYIIKKYFPEEMQEEVDHLPYKWYRRYKITLGTAIKHPELLPGKTMDAYQKFEDDYTTYLTYFDEQLSHQNDLLNIMSLNRELDQHFEPHYLLAFTGAIHGVISTSFLKGYIEKWFNDQTLYDRLFSNVPNRTMETNNDLFDFAEEVRTDDHLSALFEKPAEEILNALSAYPHLNERFHFLVEKHGDRCPDRDIVYPRWKETPVFVIEIIKQIISNPKKFTQLKEENETKQHKAEQELQVIHFNRKRILKKHLYYARLYIQFREEQRYVLDLHLSRKRSIFLKIGTLLKENNILGNNTDIFFFDGKELEDLAAGKISDAKERARATRIKYELYKRAHPPEFLRGDQEIRKKGMAGDILQGIAASSGKSTGITQIVMNIEELPLLKENSILVTRFTDPGWTPCFHKISGLVTEIGGILSHGAIIAREYGIPAVTGIEHVFDYLSSGDMITVNGTEGKVYIDKKNEGPRKH